MRLLDDVRLTESEVLAPPTASTFERLITKQASYEHSDSWTKLYNSMIGSHRWKKTVEKYPISLVRLYSDKVKSPNPPQWNIA